MAGSTSPYVPGWDCHGLPIELQVDKELGPKKKEMSTGRRSAAPAATTPRSSSTSSARSSSASASCGDWDDPYLTMAPSYEADIVRELGRVRARSGVVYQGKKPVHWCISCRTALAEAEVEYDGAHLALHLRAFRFDGRGGDAARRCAGEAACYAVIWTTTPWTLPANLAIALPSRRSTTSLLEADGESCCVVAEELAEDRGRRRARLDATGASSPTFKGAELERTCVPPPVRRPRLARRPRRLRDARGRHRRSSTPRPATAPDDYRHRASSTASTIYCPVDDARPLHRRGRALRRASASSTRTRRSSSMPARARRAPGIAARITHSYPHCWRCKNPIIFRATEQWFIAHGRGPATLRERGARRDRARCAGSRPGAQERIQQHDREPPRLVHLAPARLGRADPGLLLRGLRRAAARPETRATRGGHSSSGRAPTPGSTRAARSCCPPGLRVPEVRRRRRSRKERDILDVWFDSGVSHAAVLRAAPGPGLARATSTWRAATSTAAGSTRRSSSASARAAARRTAGRHPRLHRRRRGREDLEDARQRRRPAEDHQASTAPRSCASGSTMVDYRDDMRDLARDPGARRRGLPQDPQHDPLPAREPLRLRSGRDAAAADAARRARPLRAGRAHGRSWRAARRPTRTTSSTSSTTRS